MRAIRKIALALVIIGAVNWGLIGLFQFDLVASLFGGQDAALARLVYVLVGISGLICLSYFADADDAELTDHTDSHRRYNQPIHNTEVAEEIDPAYEAEQKGIKEDRE